jgi:hypothetical protein
VAGASRSTNAATSAASTARTPSTCPVPTDVTRSGRRNRRWAGKIGPNTEGLIVAVLASRPHPEQGFRTCLGILRSYRGLDPAHLEGVSARAVELSVLNCKGVAALLARKHAAAAGQDDRPATLFDHANLRGPGYFH